MYVQFSCNLLITKMIFSPSTEMSKEELMLRIVVHFNIKLPSNTDTSTEQSQSQSQTAQGQHMSLREKLLARHVANRSQSGDNSIAEELNRFQNNREMHNDVLQFWAKFGGNYPILSTIARVLFCIQATTATAESAFSFAGSVIRSRRATIDPFRVEKVLFIHDNYDLFNM